MIPENIGRYQVRGELGRGGMATVYRAYDARFGREVAIKVLPATLLNHATARMRFEREARTIAALEHSAIVPVYDYNHEGGIPFLVMRLMPGGTLGDRLKQGSLAPGEVIRILHRIAAALDESHKRGIIHRDIKPNNILFDQYDEAYLSDFGIVHLAQDSDLTNQEVLLGTPGYMSPEQIESQELDGRSDVYSLGVVIFEMLSGNRPFRANNPVQVLYKQVSTLPPHLSDFRPDLPLACDLLLEQTLDKNPAQRPQTAVLLVNQLAEILSPLAPHLVIQQPVESPHPTSETPATHTKFPQTPTYNHIPIPFQAPNLPPHFVHRSEHVVQLQQLLTEPPHTIVGIVGLGGVGKTSLAIKLAHALREEFPDGVLWGQLDSSTPDSILVGFATAFGRAQTAGQNTSIAHTAQLIQDILAYKKVLLVLDNAEDSEQLKWLLPNSQETRTIITTRNRKMLTTLGAAVVELSPFSPSEGIAFLQTAVGQQRVLAELSVAQQLVECVGGLPLALSITAGFLKEAPDLTLHEYNDLLQNTQTRLDNLTDWEGSQRSVTASFEISYRVLPPNVQQLFVALSVFDGPDFGNEAVAAILQWPVARVKMDIGRLRSLSLLEMGVKEDDTNQRFTAVDSSRYYLHPLLKAFATQKAGSSQEALRERAAAYFVALAEQNSYPEGYRVLDGEWQNIVGAIEWAFQKHRWDIVVKGALALTRHHLGVIGFMDARGYWGQARQLLANAQKSLMHLQAPLAQATILANLGAFAVRQADYDTAKPLLDEADVLLQNLPQEPPILIQRSQLYDFFCQLVLPQERQNALTWIQKGISLLDLVPLQAAKHQQGYLLIQLAGILGRMGELEKALDYAQTGLALLPAHPTSARISGLNLLGVICYLRGETGQSLVYYEESIPLAQQLNDYRRLATLWLNIANNHERQGKLYTAVADSQKALQLYQQMGDPYNQCGVLINLSKCCFRLGKPDEMLNYLITATELAKNHQFEEVEALAKSILAEWHIASQQFMLATTTLARVREIGSRLQLTYLLPTVIRLQAEVALNQGDIDAAQNAVEEALSLANHNHDVTEEGVGWRVKGSILQAAGEVKEAQLAFERGVELLTEQDLYELAKSQLALGIHYRLHGSEVPVTDIETLWQTAMTTFQKLGAVREFEKAQTLVRPFINQGEQ